MSSPRFLLAFALFLAAASLSAQEKPAEAGAKPKAAGASHSVTLIFRMSGSNVPVRFTSYLDVRGSYVRMPLLHTATQGWVASIDTDLDPNNASPVFNFEIEDTFRLETRSSDQVPFTQRPVDILDVRLPLQIGSEIPVYESSAMKIAIRFDALSK